mgnify:CR=1 FL=1
MNIDPALKALSAEIPQLRVLSHGRNAGQSRAIRTGDARVCLAGGVESMSRAPWSMAKPEAGFPTGAPAVFDTA